MMAQFHHGWSLPDLYCCFYLSSAEESKTGTYAFQGSLLIAKLLKEVPLWILCCKHVVAMFFFLCIPQWSPFLYLLPVMYVRPVNILSPHGHTLYPLCVSYTYILSPHTLHVYKVYNILLPPEHTHYPSCMYGMHSFYYRIGVPSVHVEQPDLCRPPADRGMVG